MPLVQTKVSKALSRTLLEATARSDNVVLHGQFLTANRCMARHVVITPAPAVCLRTPTLRIDFDQGLSSHPSLSIIR